ncbi:ABC transporter substrate-binding protein [Methanobrevibacter sp. OttesenSCG-928-K11]|nr:ABC transporter substrate-binding protein [Methanobrevibacter sp. OttesenSCG-928-K11]MDL2270706.1 ABC transporter substrate-binding protein [Methanobrevibacter sp. OttesenSCG-928-I08]
MKKNKIIVIGLCVLFIAGLGVHFFMTPNSNQSGGDINITDMANRTVKIPSTVNTVVATSPPMTTMVYMLAPEKLKGVNFQWTDEEIKYVPNQYRNLPVIGGWFGSQDGNYEEFIASEPDIVIEAIDEGMGVNIDTVNERQDKFGSIPVVTVIDSTNVSNLEPSITFMGKILNADDKAQELNDFNNKYLNQVKEVTSSLSSDEKKRVYYAESVDGLETDPSGSSHSQLITLCGGVNVADGAISNGTSTVQVSMEQVMGWNPEVIITTNEEFYNKIYTDSNWANIDAVKNKEVYLSPQSPFKWFDRPPGANVIIGVPWTAKVLYPDKYADLDLIKTTQDFYSNFYHYDLSDDEAKDILIGSGIKEKNL